MQLLSSRSFHYHSYNIKNTLICIYTLPRNLSSPSGGSGRLWVIRSRSHDDCLERDNTKSSRMGPGTQHPSYTWGGRACQAVTGAEWCPAYKAGKKELWHSAAKDWISLLLTGNSCVTIDIPLRDLADDDVTFYFWEVGLENGVSQGGAGFAAFGILFLDCLWGRSLRA